MLDRKRVRRTEEESEVNVTPLLDIVFIMLIFFIVTATFVYEDGFEPNLPEPSPEQNDSKPPPSLLLYVQQNGLVQIDGGRSVDPRSIKNTVAEFLASKPQGVVQITVAPGAKSGVAVLTLDQARQVDPNGKIIIAKAAAQ